MTDPIPAFISRGELEQLRGAKTLKEWDDIVELIKSSRGGLLPPDWQVRVVAQGLQYAKEQQFAGMKPVEKLTDPEEMKAEATGLLVMMEDLFMAMLAIQTAISIRSAHMGILAISQKDGFVFDIVIEKPDPNDPEKMIQVNQRTPGLSHLHATIGAGKDCHRQLMLLHQNTGKLQDYVDRVAKLDELKRLREKRILDPSGN